MKKNSQYIGVDDKFVPEDEKYVDDSLLGDKEETNRKIKKTAKVIGIGYLVYISIGLIMFAVVVVIIVKVAGGIFNQAGGIFNQAASMTGQIGNQIGNQVDTYNEMSNNFDSALEKYNEATSNFDSAFEKQKTENAKKSFNWSFEIYSGTKKKMSVMSILDNVVKNNKTNPSQTVTVIYNENNTADANAIIELKKSFSEGKDYEVILDYDDNGYVNKVTIKDI